MSSVEQSAKVERGWWLLLIRHLDFVILMCQVLKLQEGQTNYIKVGGPHGLSKQKSKVAVEWGDPINYTGVLLHADRQKCSVILHIHTERSTYGPHPWSSGSGVPDELKTSAWLCFFLSFYIHFSHPLPVIFDIYFWARWLALHGLALGAALSGRRPLVCPPSVAVAGWEYQTFEVINLKECIAKFSLCFGDTIGLLERDLFQWQTNNRNLCS
ncbi:hypothetical protein QQF64_002637 [Cirrhinus molitorella]|uniref:Uncharacterized protein n=1 Tax=Cirrhinus molitorella TaxID=172907 RepID=A0ABR3MQS9_9TELE